MLSRGTQRRVLSFLKQKPIPSMNRVQTWGINYLTIAFTGVSLRHIILRWYDKTLNISDYTN